HDALPGHPAARAGPAQRTGAAAHHAAHTGAAHPRHLHHLRVPGRCASGPRRSERRRWRRTCAGRDDGRRVMTDLAIDIAGLHKRYGAHVAVHRLDMQVRPGSVHGLIGPNGAGKTTTLRTLVDIIRPTSGRIRVLGEDPRSGGPRLRRRIGYVPGELRLDGRATGHRMLSFYSGVSGSVDRRYAGELGERLGVDLSRPVRDLSKGNKQKLGLIQAFMHRPELLILDEPTSGLDPLMQREFLALVREARDAGQTVLLSSHVLSEIQQAADDVSVLAEGRIVAAGDVSSLRLNSVRRVRAALAETDAAVRRTLTGVPGLSDVETE